jgi:hypothetical protein
MSESNEFDILGDIRARVIYYSCLAEPRNILEISNAWNYKTSTYFYQKRSKAIIEIMEEKKLISAIKGAHFETNYDLLLEQNQTMNFFEKTNLAISNQIITERFEWEVTETQLEDPLFREFCLEKKPELKEILEKARMTKKDIGDFLSLWKTHLFRKTFLTTDSLNRLIEDRQHLPQNPREFLFSVTTELCENIYSFKKESAREFAIFEFPNPYSWYDIDEILPLLVKKLEASTSSSSEELETFRQKFQSVYKSMSKKFKLFEDTSEISTYHMAKLVKIIGV